MKKINKMLMTIITILVLLLTTNTYADEHSIESVVYGGKAKEGYENSNALPSDKLYYDKDTKVILDINVYTSYCDSTIKANIEYDPKYLKIESSEKSTYVLDIEKNDNVEQGRLDHKYTYNVCSSEYTSALENIKFKVINNGVDSTIIKVNGKEHIVSFNKSEEENPSTNEKDENNTGNDSQDKPITSEIIENNTTTNMDKESKAVPGTKLGLSVNDTLTILIIADIILFILVLVLIIGNINRKHNK